MQPRKDWPAFAPDRATRDTKSEPHFGHTVVEACRASSDARCACDDNVAFAFSAANAFAATPAWLGVRHAVVKLWIWATRPCVITLDGHFSLQFTVADEKHDGAENRGSQLQMFGETLRVPEILAERILESEFLSEMGDGPLRGMLGAENPSVVILRFDHEDAEARYQNVIDLGCAVAARHNHVVKAPVNPVVEQMPHPELGDFLAEPAFEKRTEHERGFWRRWTMRLGPGQGRVPNFLSFRAA